MSVILVTLTFLVFGLVDYILGRRERRKPVRVSAAPVGSTLLRSAVVAGFLAPEQLRYHPGHSWVLRERRNLVRTGMDEFAAAIVGLVERIELPRPGQWIRQGQQAWVFHRNGEKAEMVSPTEGEVVEVNLDLLEDPSLAQKDPYGKGWLMTVHVPDEQSTNRNLVPGTLVKSWLGEAAERLYARQPQLAGPVAADGGRPAMDIATGLSDASWKKLTKEFFLT